MPDQRYVEVPGAAKVAQSRERLLAMAEGYEADGTVRMLTQIASVRRHERLAAAGLVALCLDVEQGRALDKFRKQFRAMFLQEDE